MLLMLINIASYENYVNSLAWPNRANVSINILIVRGGGTDPNSDPTPTLLTWLSTYHLRSDRVGMYITYMTLHIQ